MGMVIEYCAGCRNRIDANELRAGTAGAFEGQTYCMGCLAGRACDAPVRRSTRRRRGAGHRGRRTAPRRSSSSPVRMACAAAAAAAAVMVIAVASCSGAPESPHHTPAHLLDPADDLAPTSDVRVPRETTEARLRRELAVSQLETRFAEARRFEQRHAAPEQWSRVDATWRAVLADERWERDGIASDESAVRLRTKAEKARAVARERFEVAGRDAIRVALAKARGFASHGYLQHAARALASVPGVFHALPEYRQITAARRALMRHLAANG